MANVSLAPIFNGQQFFDNNGNMLSGGKIFTYTAGSSSILQTTYTTVSGLVANTNPIVLDSSGRLDTEIWIDITLAYNFIVTASDGTTLMDSRDDISTANTIGLSPTVNQEWLPTNVTPTYVSTVSFTVPGDLTATLTTGRRIRATLLTGMVYGVITSSVYTTLTTITLRMDGIQVLDNTLSAIYYGIISYFNTSSPISAVLTQNSQSANYTLILADGYSDFLLHPSADTSARTWTIPANSVVAFPVGTVIVFVNQNAGGIITIATTTDTMRLAGAGTTGSRSLAANGVATAIKIATTEWIISGVGLT